MNDTSYILHATDTQAAKDWPALGDDKPAKINGVDVRYYWKPMLQVGRYVHPSHGWELSVTPEKLANLHRNHKRLRENGIKPFVPEKHKDYDANKNFGWLLETKIEGDTLFGLHQLIGPDAHLAAARNDSSVCIKKNYKDGRGNVYDEVIEHNALCPDPVATGLGGFVALSASASGPESVAPVYVMAADRSSTMPTLTSEQRQRLQKLLPAGAALPDEASTTDFLIAQLETAAKVASPPPEIATVLSRATAAETERDKLKSELQDKVLQLSRTNGEKDQPVLNRDLHYLNLALKSERDKVLASGAITPAIADKLQAKFVGVDTAAFQLTRSPVDGGAKVEAGMSTCVEIFRALEGNMPTPKLGEQTGIQQLSRQTPGAPEDKDKKTPEQIANEASQEVIAKKYPSLVAK